MKPIAVTLLPGGRRDFFWLNIGFQMMSSYETRNAAGPVGFGGIFTSAPVAVTAMVQPVPVLSTGSILVGSSAPANRDGVPVESNTPVMTVHGLVGGVLGRPLAQRTDLFGLGLDYAMYHKRFWGIPDQHDLNPWQQLGGNFISAPAAIAWSDSCIDVFGVMEDHTMQVKTCIGEQWTPNWLSLGGSFTSAATLVSREPKRLDVFARGADFTLRGNHSDSTTWFGWQNHGGELASCPVAVSWGFDRIDIFAIFKDDALWHRWWDGRLWNDWESLGGKYIGEPAVAAWAPGRLDIFMINSNQGLSHQSFNNNTWSLPESLGYGSNQRMAGSPTVISNAANHLEVFVPTEDVFLPMDDKQVRLLEWDGQAWSQRLQMSGFGTPQRYRMSVDYVRAVTTRATLDDTDAAMISVAVGNEKARIKTQWIGEIGGGVGGPETSQTNLLKIESVNVDLAEPFSFSYIVVNNGHASQDKILAALESGGNSLSLAGSSSMQEDIAKGVVKFITVKIVDVISVDVPVVGSILKKIESWLMNKLINDLFEDCDGIVAVELRAMMGRDLHILTDNGRKTIKVTTYHEGTDSSWNCGAKSEYEVTWTIQPL